ncbi:MAG: acyl-CoA thioesterase [Verrucomicrobiales bacterium]|nr:acyl-CoA thioesterase [Verrucomicrobiales bacterium]
MENHRLIRPEHLNHYGFLFGGYLLMWVDEMAWLAATEEFPDCKFVTVGMDQVAFKKSVKEGSILRFSSTKLRIGNTSITYDVKVSHQGVEIFSTSVTLVRVDDQGRKTPILKK